MLHGPEKEGSIKPFGGGQRNNGEDTKLHLVVRWLERVEFQEWVIRQALGSRVTHTWIWIYSVSYYMLTLGTFILRRPISKSVQWK